MTVLIALLIVGLLNVVILRWLRFVTYERGIADGREAEKRERIERRAASLLHRTERRLSIVADTDDVA